MSDTKAAQRLPVQSVAESFADGVVTLVVSIGWSPQRAESYHLRWNIDECGYCAEGPPTLTLRELAMRRA